jgi:hypothetical protein
MKFLFYLFMACFWYGIAVGALGAALAAFAWSLFSNWATGYMQAQEDLHRNSPDNAHTPPDALVLLSRAGVECS